MAKIYGLFGSMTGKLADVVMAVRNGEQVARKYQPVVSNPSTLAQVAQRAKMKLMSQLSAVMAPVIAMPRQGSVSSRNIFTKVNFPLTSFAEGEAEINLNGIQLTKSVVGMPSISVVRDAGRLTAGLAADDRTVPLDVDRVIYAMFEKQVDERLRFVSSVTSNDAGTDGSWGVELPNTNNSVVVLAYGVRDNTEAAKAIFGNMEAPTAEQVANLIVTRTLTETDVTLTETRGATLAAASREAVIAPEKQSKK